jgi:hypothetical protein
MVIYWRCSKCEVIESTSPLCQEVLHTHVLDHEQIVKYNLLACRTMAEAKSYRAVKLKGRFGLRKPPKKRKR